jgi:hypothetical protein
MGSISNCSQKVPGRCGSSSAAVSPGNGHNAINALARKQEEMDFKVDRF